jgi:hypothetical protein
MYRSSAYLGFLVGDNKSRRVPRIHRGIVRGAEPTVQTAPLVSSAPAGGILATPSVRGKDCSALFRHKELCLFEISWEVRQDRGTAGFKKDSNLRGQGKPAPILGQ